MLVKFKVKLKNVFLKLFLQVLSILKSTPQPHVMSLSYIHGTWNICIQ